MSTNETNEMNEQILAVQKYVREYISQVTKGTSYVEKKERYIRCVKQDDTGEEIVYIGRISVEKYFIRQYRVLKGVEYRIYGRGVHYIASNPIALFTQGPDEGQQNPGTVILHYDSGDNNTRELRDYDTPFTPDTDGYITIATHEGCEPLRVDLAYGKPLKIQVFGDSMSDNYDVITWLDYLPDELRGYDVTVKNSAIGGSTLTHGGHKTNTENTENQEDTENQEGTENQENQEGTENQENTVEEKSGVAYLITDPEGSVLEEDNDLVIVFSGCNDWATNIESVGHMGDTSIKTIYGAVDQIIHKVCGGTNTKLLFITPMQRKNKADEGRPVDGEGNMLNKGGGPGCFTVVSVVDAIKEVCAKYAIPCMDMYREGYFNMKNIGQMTYDGLHASESGAKMLAKLIGARIKMLV